MADERRRQLERQAGAGDPGAAADLLRDRLRLGEVTVEGLQVAAALGHPVARAALDAPLAAVPAQAPGWVEALVPFGKPLLVRAALSVARPLLPWLEESLPGDRRPRAAVEAAEAWLACPCESCRTAARLAGEEAAEVEAAAVDLALDDGAVFATTVFVMIGLCAGEQAQRVEHAAAHAGRAAVEADTVAEERGEPPGSASAAARQALMRWALGEA